MRSLDTLFAPRAVAILGASNDETKYGNWISVQALRMSRPVYLINRRGEKGNPDWLPYEELPNLKRVPDLLLPPVGAK